MNFISNKNLILINSIIVAYFLLLWIIHVLSLDMVLIGVVREMLTIPMVIAAVVFLGIGIHYTIKNKTNIAMLISLLALALCTMLIIGSFFWNTN